MSNSGKVQGVDKLVMNGLFIGLLIWVSFLFTNTSFDPGYAIRHLGLSFFCFSYTAYFIVYRKYPFPLLNKLQWVGLSSYLFYSLAGIGSAAFGVNPSEGVSPFLINVNFLVFILIVTHALFHGLRVSSILYVAALIGIVSSTFGLLQFFEMLPKELIVGAPPTAFQFNRNFFASSQVLIFPFTLIGIVFFGGIKRKVSILSAVLVLLSISISQTRSAILSMVVFGLTLLFVFIYDSWKSGTIRQKKGITSLLTLVFFVLVGAFGTYYFQNIRTDLKKFYSNINYNARQSSVEERLTIWKGSLEDVFVDHPVFGVGFGNWKIHYSGSRNQPGRAQRGRVVISKAHNVYIEALCETGIIGFLSYLLFVVIILKITSNHVFQNNTVMIIGAGYFAYLSDQVFSFGNYQPTHIAYIGLLLGYLFYVELPEPKRRIRRKVVPMFGTIATLISLFAIYWFLTFLFFEESYEKGLKTRKNGAYRESLYYFEGAVQNVHSLNRDGRSPHLEKAIVFNQEKLYDLALLELQKAWKVNPFNPRVQEVFGRSYYGNNEFIKAEFHFEKAYDVLSRSDDIIESLAICYFKNHKYDKCITLLEETEVDMNQQLLLIKEVSKKKVYSN